MTCTLSRVQPFVKVNLMDLDDGTPATATEMDGRFGRSALGSRDLGVSRMAYAPGARGTFAHRHRTQEEAYVVVGGGGEALLDGEVVELRRWDVLRVAPEVLRAFAGGPDGLELVAVGGPTDGFDGLPGEAVWPAG